MLCNRLLYKTTRRASTRVKHIQRWHSSTENAYTTSLPTDAVGGTRLEDVTMATNTKLNFTIPNKNGNHSVCSLCSPPFIGSLQKVLNCFKKHEVSLSYIRSDRVPDDFARNRGKRTLLFFSHHCLRHRDQSRVSRAQRRTKNTSSHGRCQKSDALHHDHRFL